jgi:hypothetical protein
MLKKILGNSSFLFLLAGNIYCIWYYQNNPDAFVTVVWIYWFQSVTIGIFNFLDLLTLKNFDGNDFKLNDKPLSHNKMGGVAWFFLLHYGFFHFVYTIFLLVDFGIRSINKMVLIIGIASFFLESILGFLKQKQLERSVKINIVIMFFLPYLRIIPMHLMIILPVFLGWKPSLLFLVLKMGADILSFILYNHLFTKSKNSQSN